MSNTRAEEDALLRDSVCYWRMCQPQVDTEDTTRSSKTNAMRSESMATASSSASENEDPEEYEVLFPSDDGTRKLLDKSAFYHGYMPSTDRVSESLLHFCSSFPIRMGPVILASLVRRFTDARFNWQNKTLQSFLEMACWTSVTYAAYSLYDDWVVALQVGTFVGALMSICDEVALQFVRGLARVIRNQHGGSELLQKLGFDIPLNGKAPTNGHEVELIKNLVFGYLGIVVIRSLWENFHDVKHFALLTAAASVAFVVTAELFCLWLPTRRVGLTLQSRFTEIRQNWEEHPMRSLVELLAWTISTSYLFYTSEDFFFSLRTGTLVAIVLCLSSGLEDLPDIVSSDDDATDMGDWQQQVSGDLSVTLANYVVKLQDAASYVGTAVQDEAMNMYENWSQ